ncbi:hypothetical protein QYE76_031199 [Lolium multiflorum]|uniref:Uncharacterized protein n=1 Tax=Lolium multiflorum TaxID=4521 RepID=A0AAD8QSQ2_LOLMU|nr:hypothetical protein QYE76_031199 [Lolium multiflorum]
MRTISAHSVSVDPAHIEVINGIEHGGTPPRLRRHDEIASIAEVDFEVVKELDFSLPPSLPWWPALNMGFLTIMSGATLSGRDSQEYKEGCMSITMEQVLYRY